MKGIKYIKKDSNTRDESGHKISNLKATSIVVAKTEETEVHKDITEKSIDGIEGPGYSTAYIDNIKKTPLELMWHSMTLKDIRIFLAGVGLMFGVAFTLLMMNLVDNSKPIWKSDLNALIGEAITAELPTTECVAIVTDIKYETLSLDYDTFEAFYESIKDEQYPMLEVDLLIENDLTEEEYSELTEVVYWHLFDSGLLGDFYFREIDGEIQYRKLSEEAEKEYKAKEIIPVGMFTLT